MHHRLRQNRCVFSARRNETGRDGEGYLHEAVPYSSIIFPLCSGLWIHSQNLLSSHYRTASEHHPTSAWVVLRVGKSAQGKKLDIPLHPLPDGHYSRSSDLLVSVRKAGSG